MEMYVTVDSVSGERKWHLATEYQVGNLPSDAQILQESVSNFGGTTADYLIYKTSDEAIMNRLRKYDEFTGTISNNVVTALDFKIEDSKKKIGVVADIVNDRIALYDDGTFDTMNITVTIYNDDGTVDTTYNKTEYIDIFNTTGKRIPSEITFVNGTVTFQFKPKHYGYYTFPAEPIRVGENGEIRVKNQLRVQVYRKVS